MSEEEKKPEEEKKTMKLGPQEITITLDEDGHMKMNGPKNKILIYGMLMMAIETVMKSGQPRIQIPPMGMKFPPIPRG